MSLDTDLQAAGASYAQEAIQQNHYAASITASVNTAKVDEAQLNYQ